MSRLRLALEPLAAALAALVVVGGFLALLGADPQEALGALVQGAFGDRLALESTLLRSVPLVLVGLAVALAFKSGIWNIGGEGQLYVGALVATALGTRLAPELPAAVLLPIVLAGGIAAGALWALVAAALKVGRGVSEVLSTLMLNFVAVLAVAWAVHGPLQELAASYPQSDPLPAAARLAFLPGLGRVHAGLLFALVLPVAAWFLLYRSAAGLRLRAVGLSTEAARYAGISPARETVVVLVLSGALAGLAGAVEIAGVTGRLFQNLSPGYGFTAIAVAMLARLHPLAVLPAAVFFAALASGSGAMQRLAGVPQVSVQVIEAAVIFFSVGFAIRRSP